MKSNKNTNGNGNGNGFVATIEAANGNGSKKAEAKSTPKDNVKVDESFEETIKITPHFPLLTTKGVEMYTDMNNLENAKLYIDGLAMAVQDETELVGLLMILDAINRKINGEDPDYVGAADYINWLQDYIFHWTSTGNHCVGAYIDAVRSGNFVVGEMPENDSAVWAEGIYPPTYRGKAKESHLRAEIDALVESVKKLQSQINERSIGVSTENSSSAEKTSSASKTEVTDIFDLESSPSYQEARKEFQQKEAKAKEVIQRILKHSDADNNTLNGLVELVGLLEIEDGVSQDLASEIKSWLTNEAPEPAAEPDVIDQLFYHRLERITNHLCHVLDSEKVSDDMKDALQSIIVAVSNHTGTAIDYDTDILRIAFPKAINSLNSLYAEGILDMIDGFLDVFIGTPVGEELNQYAKPFKSEKSDNEPEKENPENTELQTEHIVSDDTKIKSAIEQETEALENSKKLVDAILIECEHEECTIDALMLLLQIFDDAARKDSPVNVRQIIAELTHSLYTESFNFTESIDTYLESLTAGKKYPNSRINHEVFKMFPEKAKAA